MEHKERIALYLSGLADKKTERQTECALLHDTDFIESFIATVEQHLYAVPFDFADTVMRLLLSDPALNIKVPILNRKLCAAVCFCSAASIMLFTISGFERYIVDFISAQSGILNELLTFAQNFTLGGK